LRPRRRVARARQHERGEERPEDSPSHFSSPLDYLD
jgi:hypothetical protein